MENVLIIAYWFAPAAHGGTIRTTKYAKYLRNYGWNPLILTAKGNPAYWNKYDSSLLDEIPNTVKVESSRSFDPISILFQLGIRQKNETNKNHRPSRKSIKTNRPLILGFKLIYHKIIKKILIPDDYILWMPSIIKARKIIANEKIDLIYVSAPPNSAQIIGYFLKKMTALPWVADFRDGWTENPAVRQYYNKPRAKIEWWLEQKVLESADKIICATGPMMDEFKNAHPSVDPDKFITITNGFDPEDFEGIAVEKAGNKKFTITHTGSLGNIRTPDYFIKSVKELIEVNTELRQDLQVFFVGTLTDNSKNLIRNLNIEGNVKIIGYVSHKESIEYQLKSDALLLIFHFNEGGKGILTGKLFEYIGAQKPILALIHEGIAKDLILSEKMGVVAEIDNIDQIKEKIGVLYNLWKNGNLGIKTNPELLKRFDRRELTRQLAEVFDEVVIEHKEK